MQATDAIKSGVATLQDPASDHYEILVTFYREPTRLVEVAISKQTVDVLYVFVYPNGVTALRPSEENWQPRTPTWPEWSAYVAVLFARYHSPLAEDELIQKWCEDFENFVQDKELVTQCSSIFTKVAQGYWRNCV